MLLFDIHNCKTWYLLIVYNFYHPIFAGIYYYISKVTIAMFIANGYASVWLEVIFADDGK